MEQVLQEHCYMYVKHCGTHSETGTLVLAIAPLMFNLAHALFEATHVQYMFMWNPANGSRYILYTVHIPPDVCGSYTLYLLFVFNHELLLVILHLNMPTYPICPHTQQPVQ